MRRRHFLTQSIVLVILFTGACSTRNQTPKPEVVLDKNYITNEEGVVEYVWEPPLVDVIDVPPGLDPEGIYYRPSHQSVVEIRQGRWKYYKQNQDKK